MLSAAISRRGYMVGFKNSGKQVDIDKKYVMATFPGENILSLREFKKMYPEQTYKYHTYPTSVLLSELRTILLYVYTNIFQVYFV